MERNEPETVAGCKHHWLLGQPNQGVVPGKCRICGAERQYPAVLEDADRYYGSDRSMSSEGLLGTGVGGARPYPTVDGARLLADSES
jgi:hypothetical protein